MCRLLGLYGQVEDWRNIITAFSKQAETGNVAPGDGIAPGHKDGWGLAISNNKQTAMVPLVRQLGSAYQAPGLREALYALPDRPEIMLCHLRKASDTVPITLPNAHPFVHNGWAFIHNGTVYGADTLPRDSDLVMSSDDSDTEHFFHYLLTAIYDRPPDKTIEAAIRDAVSSLALDYTSLNFMLSNGSKSFVARCFKKHPAHFTLYYYRLAAGFIVCSEPIALHGLSQDRWVLLPNHSLLCIYDRPPRIEEIRL